jgi:hypothetical protein
MSSGAEIRAPRVEKESTAVMNASGPGVGAQL